MNSHLGQPWFSDWTATCMVDRQRLPRPLAEDMPRQGLFVPWDWLLSSYRGHVTPLLGPLLEGSVKEGEIVLKIRRHRSSCWARPTWISRVCFFRRVCRRAEAPPSALLVSLDTRTGELWMEGTQYLVRSASMYPCQSVVYSL